MDRKPIKVEESPLDTSPQSKKPNQTAATKTRRNGKDEGEMKGREVKDSIKTE